VSAPFDYSGLLATADRLIERFGRTVTLRRKSESPATASKPWGPASSVASDIQAIETTAVFLGPQFESFDSVTAGIGLGVTNVEEKTGRVLVKALAATLPEELQIGWQIDDGTRVFEIISSRPIKPGGTLMYHDVRVKL